MAIPEGVMAHGLWFIEEKNKRSAIDSL